MSAYLSNLVSRGAGIGTAAVAPAAPRTSGLGVPAEMTSPAATVAADAPGNLTIAPPRHASSAHVTAPAIHVADVRDASPVIPLEARPAMAPAAVDLSSAQSAPRPTSEAVTPRHRPLGSLPASTQLEPTLPTPAAAQSSVRGATTLHIITATRSQENPRSPIETSIVTAPPAGQPLHGAEVEVTAGRVQVPKPVTSHAAESPHPVEVTLEAAKARQPPRVGTQEARREASAGTAEAPIHVRIGKVEVRAPAPAPRAAPTTTPAPRAEGFARYRRLRTYRN